MAADLPVTTRNPLADKVHIMCGMPIKSSAHIIIAMNLLISLLRPPLHNPRLVHVSCYLFFEVQQLNRGKVNIVYHFFIIYCFIKLIEEQDSKTFNNSNHRIHISHCFEVHPCLPCSRRLLWYLAAPPELYE